jgi:hypothetical protein
VSPVPHRSQTADLITHLPTDGASHCFTVSEGDHVSPSSTQPAIEEGGTSHDHLSATQDRSSLSLSDTATSTRRQRTTSSRYDDVPSPVIPKVSSLSLLKAFKPHTRTQRLTDYGNGYPPLDQLPRAARSTLPRSDPGRRRDHLIPIRSATAQTMRTCRGDGSRETSITPASAAEGRFESSLDNPLRTDPHHAVHHLQSPVGPHQRNED